MHQSKNQSDPARPQPHDSVIRFLKVVTLALLAAIFLIVLADVLRN